MRRVIRVFPRRTSYTPDDELAFAPSPKNPLGAYPQLLRPKADAVWVSVTFTWDIEQGQQIKRAWSKYYEDVQIGGPAFGSPNPYFEPGCFVKRGIVFTSRGCDKHCLYCLVPDREGPLQLIWPIADGHVVQDNNFLACPSWHRKKVYEMLRRQARAAEFKGGLDPRLVTDEIAAEFRDLHISEAWLACDTEAALKPLERAVQKLQFLLTDADRERDGHSNKIRCYALVGHKGETSERAARRLEQIWEAGAMPFAQLLQPKEKYIHYSKEWRDLARIWMRPAAMRASHNLTSAPKLSDTVQEVMFVK